LPIGKCYTQEALIRLGLEGKKVSELDEAQVRQLLGTLAEMMKTASPCVYEKSAEKEAPEEIQEPQNQMLELSLVPLHSQALGVCKPFSTFSEAVGYFFAHAQVKEEKGESPALIKLRHRLGEQESALAKLEVEIHAQSQATRWLEENLAQLEEKREKMMVGKKMNEKIDKKWIVDY